MLPDQVPLNLEQRVGPLHILWLRGVTLASSLLVGDTALGPYARPTLLTVMEAHSKLALLQPVAPLLVVAGSVPQRKSGTQATAACRVQDDRLAYVAQVPQSHLAELVEPAALHLLSRPSALVLR
jgi:hypothetical protein